MRQLTFTFFFYFGRYRICNTKIYEKDFYALNEYEAREIFKNEYPGASIKRVIDWEND